MHDTCPILCTAEPVHCVDFMRYKCPINIAWKYIMCYGVIAACDTNDFLVFYGHCTQSMISHSNITQIIKKRSTVILTPASPPIGLPSRSNSASISSIVLLIMATILGILALITASKCWMKKWKYISNQFIQFKLFEQSTSHKMPSPETEAQQDTLHPFYVPSDHNRDYFQSTPFLCVVLRACQHFC